MENLNFQACMFLHPKTQDLNSRTEPWESILTSVTWHTLAHAQSHAHVHTHSLTHPPMHSLCHTLPQPSDVFFFSNTVKFVCLQNTNSNCLRYLYLASVGRIPLGTGSMGPVLVSEVSSNICFGSGSDGRPAASDGACSCSIEC